jgi:hypothetical protein
MFWASLAVAAGVLIGTGVQVAGLWQGNLTGPVPLVNGSFPAFAGESPLVVAGEYDSASLTVQDPPIPALTMLTAAALIRCAAGVAVCAAAALLSHRLLRFRPFAKVVSSSLAVSGAVLILAAVIPGMLEAMATTTVAESLGLLVPRADGAVEGIALVGPAVELPGIAVGALLILVATAFQLAERARQAVPAST